MPRGPRLDAPGALHHVIARGIERRDIFVDDRDREDFIERLARIAESGDLAVFAWALMPNHVHLLVSTGRRRLERSMRALLAGYATRFNRRHERAGHLFQNRYKSILCEKEPYFLSLVRYVHRNPYPSVIRDISQLDCYPYTGHSAILGTVPREWQRVDAVLDAFGQPDAQRRYLAFVTGSGGGDDAVDLDGGGLSRSRNGWRHTARLEKGRERFRSDERVLGSSEFVARVLKELDPPLERSSITAPELVEAVCLSLALSPAAARGSGRARVLSKARQGIAYLWTVYFGRGNREIATELGLTGPAVHKAAKQGGRDAGDWARLLEASLSKVK